MAAGGCSPMSLCQSAPTASALDDSHEHAGEAVRVRTVRGAARAVRWHLPHQRLLPQTWEPGQASVPLPVPPV